jgi:hypothetical protein
LCLRSLGNLLNPNYQTIATVRDVRKSTAF